MIKIKIMKKSPLKGSIAVVLDDDDRVLLLLRPSIAQWAPLKWGFPGGKIEEGEMPLDAAIRETKEETQLDITNLKSVNLKVDNPVATYYTRDYNGTVVIDYEHDDWAWVTRQGMLTYDLAPEVLEVYDWVLANE